MASQSAAAGRPAKNIPGSLYGGTGILSSTTGTCCSYCILFLMIIPGFGEILFIFFLAVTGRRGAEPAAEDLPCGRLGEEPTKNLARGALSVDALFEWP